VKTYAPATDATRAAAGEVREWVNGGMAARAAMLSLEAPQEKTRAGVVGKLPALGMPEATGNRASAKKAAAPKPPVKKAAVKKSAPPKKKAKGKK